MRANPVTESAVPRASVRRSAWVLAPALVWMGLFFALPLLIVLLISFASRGTYGGVEWTFTLANYRDLVDPLYLWIYLHSLALALATTGLCLCLGFPLAYYIARAPARRQGPAEQALQRRQQAVEREQCDSHVNSLNSSSDTGEIAREPSRRVMAPDAIRPPPAAAR